MRIISFIILLVIIFIGITFASLNSNIVSFNYYVGHREIALSMLLAVTLGAGVLMGLFSGVFVYIRTKSENRRLNKRIRVIERELENLRTIPVKDPLG